MRVGFDLMYSCKMEPLCRRRQFIGMELCQYGDAEALIRAQPDGLLPLHEATACLFQMVFALYAGRVELSLRHADVKLLNFLVANGAMVGNGPSSLSKTHRGRSSRRQDVDDRGLPSTPSETSDMGGDDDDGDGEVVLVYGIGREVVQLRMPEDRAFVVSATGVFVVGVGVESEREGSGLIRIVHHTVGVMTKG